MVAALEWAFDDGIEDDNDTKVANLHARHADSRSNDALASALEAYASLAGDVRELLASFETFDLQPIDRAHAIAKVLRETPQSTGPQSAGATAARDLRDRVCKLLEQRMQLVRGGAGFVLQDFPEIRREVSSAYERRRRAASRRRAAETPATETPATDRPADESQA
jgi:hypothetical protein